MGATSGDTPRASEDGTGGGTFWSRLKLRGSKLLADPLQSRIYLACLLISGALVVLIGSNATETNRLLERNLEVELSTHLHAVGISLRESLNLADYVARQARGQWEGENTLRAHGDLINDIPNFKQLITQVAIIDRNGMLQASSLDKNVKRIDLSDRKHFLVHKTSGVDVSYLSQPLVGRVSKVLTAQFTRPILDGRGDFNGVVVVSLNFDYLQKLLLEQNGTSQHNVAVFASSPPGLGGDKRQAAIPLIALSGIAQPNGPLKLSSAATWEQKQIGKEMALKDFGLVLRVSVPQEPFQRKLKFNLALAVVLSAMLVFGVGYYAFQMLATIQSRSRILRKLEESQIKANSANAMKSKFVSSISHELRTPLNGILGFSELIGMSDDIAEAKRYGNIVNKSATHLHQMVNTLLDLAKIEAGQMEVVKIRSDVRDLCNSVLSIHRYGVEKKGLALDVKYQSGMPATIVTDHIKLMQILNNLLSNAVKFTDEGAIFITVAFEQSQWIFSVADTGIGMSPEQVNQVFERFNNVRLDDELSSERAGAGLGMALCKDFAELLGGSIHVYSELRSGTVVKVLLPQTDDL